MGCPFFSVSVYAVAGPGRISTLAWAAWLCSAGSLCRPVALLVLRVDPQMSPVCTLCRPAALHGRQGSGAEAGFCCEWPSPNRCHRPLGLPLDSSVASPTLAVNDPFRLRPAPLHGVTPASPLAASSRWVNPCPPRDTPSQLPLEEPLGFTPNPNLWLTSRSFLSKSPSARVKGSP